MEHAASMLTDHGLALVFANVLLTQLGAPIPAVPMLVMAGAYAAQGHFGLPEVLGIAIVASVLGDQPWYLAGRRYGYGILNFLCRLAVEPSTCVQQTESRLTRWGAPSLMVAKFVPGFATVAPPLAGATRLPLAAFLGYTALGAALWAGAAIGAGALLRTSVERVVEWIEIAGLRAALLLGALLALYVAVKWTQRILFMRVLRMARVSAPELYAMMQGRNPPVVLDARSPSARRADPRHIPGAIPVDFQRPQAALATLPGEREVVVYCT
jgi:membrane protein DedA with SNARE-associated domain